jgi:hypothetical protein
MGRKRQRTTDQCYHQKFQLDNGILEAQWMSCEKRYLDLTRFGRDEIFA